MINLNKMINHQINQRILKACNYTNLKIRHNPALN